MKYKIDVAECDPEEYSQSFEETLEMLYHEGIIDEDEIDEYKDCLYDYLRLYIRFAHESRPSDRLVDELYKRTLDMIEGAINSREYQKNTVEEQMRVLEDLLSYSGVEFDDNGNIISVPDDCNYSCQRDLDNYEWAIAIIEVLDNDIQFLDELKKECWLADDRLEKVICIEKFVNSTHTRGPYISTGCGLPMPENLIYDDQYIGIENAGYEANELVIGVLDCLRHSQ